MEIYTRYVNDNAAAFKKLTRRTSGKWSFLVLGEWSQSPWHQGDLKFSIRSSEDRKYWALLSSGFPNRIVAVAHFIDGTNLETAGAQMLKALREQGGGYIDAVHEYGDIDISAFSDAYFE